MLDSRQTIQEEQYHLPYHWFMNRKTFKGSKYFGYLDICTSLISEEGEAVDALSVLDAGCGDGRFLLELQERGVKQLYGLDYSQQAINFAKLFLPNVAYSCGMLKEMPYTDETFDYIFLIETLEHIPLEDVAETLSELYRVLKKNGSLIITVPSTRVALRPKHYQHFTVEKLTEYLSSEYRDIEIIGQDNIDAKLLLFLYKLVDNRYWSIKPLVNYFNLNIRPRRLNRCNPGQAARLISIAKK